MKNFCIGLLLAAGLAAPALTLADNGQNQAARLHYLEQRVEELSRRLSALEQQNRQQHVIIENRRETPATHACSVSVFGKSYEALDQNEGVARHKVRQACSTQQNAIFCTDRHIQCQTYH